MAEPGDNIVIIGAIADNGKHGWDLLWKASVTHWDRGQADPYLVAFLKAPPAAVKIPDFGMGLVAGCGRVSRHAIGFAVCILIDLVVGVRRGCPRRGRRL